MKAEGMDRREALLRCSVVVPTWKRPSLLIDTLDSLVRQSYSNMEIVVVCDGEDSDIRAIARDFRAERAIRWLFHSVNRGLAAARNSGTRAGNGEIVLFIDDDVVADRECVASHMAHHLSDDPNRRLVICGTNDEDSQRQLSSYVNECLFEAWNETRESGTRGLLEGGERSIGDDIEMSVWCGLNCSMRRDLFLGSGGFNEVFRAADEELELGLRLYFTGFEFIFDPSALLIHRNTKDLAAYSRNTWRSRGALDTYRVFDLIQRNVQTKHIVSMFHGYLLNRFAARCGWYFSGPLRKLADWLEVAANRTRRHFVFGAWARVVQTGEYWSSAKAAGCTLERLKSVVGPSRRALMLHSICEPLSKEEASYYIAPRRFKDLMRRFQRMGYKTATTAQWLRDDTPGNHVLLTFDDGYDDLYNELLPLVIEHSYTPVIYLVANRIGASNVWDQQNGLRARNLLTLEQIREMQKYGIEFGSHTLTHPWLPGVSDAELQREVGDSKHRLEDMLGVAVDSFAYPSGGVDRRVRSAVAAAGYKLAFTILPGMNWWNDPLCQRRAEINDHTTALDFAFKLRTGFGFTESISNRLRSLEQDLPTTALRKLARGVRGIGREVVHMFARDAQYDSKP